MELFCEEKDRGMSSEIFLESTGKIGRFTSITPEFTNMINDDSPNKI